MDWTSPELFEAWRNYRDAFPDSDWGMEGCGLDPSEAYALMLKSVQTGTDYLEPTYPDYPEDATIA